MAFDPDDRAACPNCGTPNRQNRQICWSCGKGLADGPGSTDVALSAQGPAEARKAGHMSPASGIDADTSPLSAGVIDWAAKEGARGQPRLTKVLQVTVVGLAVAALVTYLVVLAISGAGSPRAAILLSWCLVGVAGAVLGVDLGRPEGTRTPAWRRGAGSAAVVLAIAAWICSLAPLLYLSLAPVLCLGLGLAVAAYRAAIMIPTRAARTTVVLAVGNLAVLLAIMGTATVGAVRIDEDRYQELCSWNNLKQIALAMSMYTQDWDSRLPPMHTPAVFKKALFPYTRTNELFIQPGLGKPYEVNARLSGVNAIALTNPGSVIALQESRPHLDGRIARVYADFHVPLEQVDANSKGAANTQRPEGNAF